MSTTSLAGLEAVLGNLGLKVPVPQFPGTDILNDPLDIARCYLADIVHTIVQCGEDFAFSAIQLPPTVDPLSGDLTIILPRLAREAGIDLEELRQKILKEFPKNPLFQLPASDGKQLKIFYHSKTLAQIVLPFIQDRNEGYGTPLLDSSTKKSKVLIEFSSPNIVTELNGKHFRSTLIGAQLAKAYQTQGWEVIKVNYLGDWGKPIGLLGVGFEKFGSDELLESDTVSHLRETYARVSELFEPELAASKKARDDEKAREEIESQGIFAERNAYVTRLVNGDEKAIALWKKFREASIESYIQTYGRLNVEFDEYAGESMVKPETMQEIENALKEKGISEEKEGSVFVNLQKYGSRHGIGIIRDRTGSSTYLHREIATAIERHRQYGFDKMVYVVSNHQHEHFHRLTKILELLDMSELASKLDYILFNENSRLPEPSDPDDTLNKILDKCEQAAEMSLTVNSRQAKSLLADAHAAKSLMTSSCYAQASLVKRAGEVKFEMDNLVSFQPGTALYLQDWVARLSSIPKTADGLADQDAEGEDSLDDDYAGLLRWLALYPEVVHASFRSSEPSTVMTYIGNITEQMSDFFEDDEDISAESATDRQFLEATRIVLSNGIRQLGITRNRVRDSGVFV